MRELITVFWKELADDLTSWRFIILFALVLLSSVFASYIAAQTIRQTVADSQFVFLKLYTTSNDTLPSFLSFIIFLMPIVGIALGFDAINSEKGSGTLSRLLSQPIYRDAIINGKFLAGVATMAIMLTSIVMLVGGIGIRMIGVPPGSEEVLRLMAFIGTAVIYGAFWMGLAMLFSILFRRVATSALASVAVWIFFLFFAAILASLVANMMAPVDQTSTAQELFRNSEVNLNVSRLSPITLFQEAVIVLLVPAVRTLGLVTMSVSIWMLPTPLSLGQSLLLVWPHLVGLVALTVVCFGVSYVRFMREEIRST